MRVRYGGYTHADYEASFQHSRRPEYGPSGQKTAVIETITISGILQADTQADLTTAIRDLEAGYELDDQDFGLYTLTNQPTAHRLRASDCEYIRCSGISYPVGTGPEYTTYRNYTIQLEAKRLVTSNGSLPVPGSLADIESWDETIAYAGTGGSIQIFAPVVSGPWPEQMVNTHSPIVLTQSGSAVGTSGRPAIPPPIDASRIMNPPSDYSVSASYPKDIRQRRQHAVSWSYKMTFMGTAPIVLPIGPQ